MPRYMLDTDISSYIMKRSNQSVLSRLRMTSVDDVCISVITKCELLYGVEISPKRQRDQNEIEQLLRYVEVLDLPQGAALDYGRIRATLKRQGTMIGVNDLFIAAHALHLGLTLATNNTREFSRVDGLKIENWAELSN